MAEADVTQLVFEVKQKAPVFSFDAFDVEIGPDVSARQCSSACDVLLCFYSEFQHRVVQCVIESLTKVFFGLVSSITLYGGISHAQHFSRLTVLR